MMASGEKSTPSVSQAVGGLLLLSYRGVPGELDCTEQLQLQLGPLCKQAGRQKACVSSSWSLLLVR